MDQKQSFNLTADFLNGYSSYFIKLVFVIIAVYLIIMILNFLRDKFINTPTDNKRDDILELLTILNKLFLISGLGFIIGAFFQALFDQAARNHKIPTFRGIGDYFVFGIIIIFIGIGFKVAKNVLKKERVQ
jgi:hypothetical protein